MLAVLVAAGCGGAGGSGTLKQPAIGFTMRVPRGWKLSKEAPDLCYRGDGTGMVTVEPRGGESFDAYVSTVSHELGARVVSRNATTVAGRRAVEVVLDVPSTGAKALRLYLDLGEQVATVGFAMPASDFEGQESPIREAFGTISLE